jgi:hypothetical protein
MPSPSRGGNILFLNARYRASHEVFHWISMWGVAHENCFDVVEDDAATRAMACRRMAYKDDVDDVEEW